MKTAIRFPLGLCAVLWAAGSFAQCPDVVGTWTYTYNMTCAPAGPVIMLEETGYTNLLTQTVYIIDQDACLFRGYTVEADEFLGVYTNYIVGSIHAAKSNVYVRAASMSGVGQINKTATSINNFILQFDDFEVICSTKGKLTKSGPLP